MAQRRSRLRRLRSLRAILKPSQPATGVWHRTGTEPDLLVVLDSTSPSNIAALAQPLAHLPLDRIAVLAPLDITGQLPKASWTATAADLRSDLRSIRSVLLAADYLPLGASVVANMQHNTRLLYVQHGLLTPVAPPLPRNCTVLAFSDADAAFWTEGRQDVSSQAVGSQLLWAAGETRVESVDAHVAPVWLGQLHGAELPRNHMAAAAEDFCLTYGAIYRPHPAETDRASRRQHHVWMNKGIHFGENAPLSQTRNPIVSIFSTGVIEAAAMGLPSWVFYPNPPRWLEEFWERYSMHRWGDADPTPAPLRADTSPAQRVAKLLEDA